MGGYPRGGTCNMEESRKWIAGLLLHTGYGYLRSPEGAQRCFSFSFFSPCPCSLGCTPHVCVRHTFPALHSFESRWEEDEVIHDPILGLILSGPSCSPLAPPRFDSERGGTFSSLSLDSSTSRSGSPFEREGDHIKNPDISHGCSVDPLPSLRQRLEGAAVLQATIIQCRSKLCILGPPSLSPSPQNISLNTLQRSRARPQQTLDQNSDE